MEFLYIVFPASVYLKMCTIKCNKMQIMKITSEAKYAEIVYP